MRQKLSRNCASYELEKEIDMFRVWQMVHPMRALTLLYIFLALLAFTIHFILLSTERYNWLKDSAAKTSQTVIERVIDHG